MDRNCDGNVIVTCGIRRIRPNEESAVLREYYYTKPGGLLQPLEFLESFDLCDENLTRENLREAFECLGTRLMQVADDSTAESSSDDDDDV